MCFGTLLNIITYLSEHNMEFRATKDTLFSKNNRNFLGLVTLIGKYDPILSEHIRKIQNKRNSQSLSWEDDPKRFKEAKYFSVILDCTSGMSHQEQLPC